MLRILERSDKLPKTLAGTNIYIGYNTLAYVNGWMHETSYYCLKIRDNLFGRKLQLF